MIGTLEHIRQINHDFTDVRKDAMRKMYEQQPKVMANRGLRNEKMLARRVKKRPKETRKDQKSTSIKQQPEDRVLMKKVITRNKMGEKLERDIYIVQRKICEYIPVYEIRSVTTGKLIKAHREHINNESTWNKKNTQLQSSSQKNMKNMFREKKIPDDYHTDRAGQVTTSSTYWSQQTQFTHAHKDESSTITTMYLWNRRSNIITHTAKMSSIRTSQTTDMVRRNIITPESVWEERRTREDSWLIRVIKRTSRRRRRRREHIIRFQDIEDGEERVLTKCKDKDCRSNTH